MSPRSFAVLALATAASVGLAAHAVRQRDLPLQAAAVGQPMFPGLLDQLNEIREVRVTTPAGKLAVVAKDAGWVLTDKAGYPVEAAKVRNLGLALANLQLVEAKTADPGRLPRLDLVEPGDKDAKGRLVELMTADGGELAAAVIGKASPSLYGSGRGGVYVRRAGDDQAWLAAGDLDLPADAMAWLDEQVVDVPLDQVARVVLEPPGQTAVTLSRPDGSADFVTDAVLPDGRKLDPVKVESLAGALAGLTMSDVRPASEVADLPNQRHSRFQTFAGDTVTVTVSTVGEGDDAKHWLTLRDATDPAPAKPTDLGATIRKRADWAYEVPSYMADRLLGGLDQLLADPTPAS